MNKLLLFLSILFTGYFSFSQSLTRGPFLQMGYHNAMTIRWSTSGVGVGKIKFGESFSNKNKSVSVPLETLSHEIRVTNLKPKTKYYYSIFHNEVLLQGDTSNYFYTSPLPGNSSESVRMVAFGDCGTLQPAQFEVAKRVSEYFGGKPIDGMLLLGDNAYNYGFDREYQSNFFNVYQNFFLKNTVLWPTPGNHDYSDRSWPNDIGVRPDYYKIFSLPTKGESGGVASGNASYYSYDYANVHFVSLDSYGTEDLKKMSDTLSKQVLWLKKDLAANKLPWTVVYFHHPPYTKGSHDSDTELDLVAIRENLVKVLDYYKVDVVLNGHSHNYERSYMLNRYYANETSFNVNTHAISNSTGKYDGSPNSCPYIKSGSGTVYVVAGASGKVDGYKPGYPHNAMVTSNSETTGAMILEVTDNKFVAKYLTANGSIFDQFTIFKDVNKKSQKTIECGELVTFSNSWKGDFLTTVGKTENGKLTIDSLNKSVQFTISDRNNCLKDTISVIVKPFNVPKAISNSPLPEAGTLQLEAKYEGIGSLTWVGPNNFIGKGQKEIIHNVKNDYAGKYYLIANYKSCTALDSVQVEVLKVLNSEEPDSAYMKVFPNPSEGLFDIEIDIEEAGYYVPMLINTSGIIVKKYESEKMGIGKKHFLADLTLKDSGLYFFVLRGPEKIFSTRIIKK